MQLIVLPSQRCGPPSAPPPLLPRPILTHTATHTATGIALKISPDLLVTSPAGRHTTLNDFKTTSCQNYVHFLAITEQYDYDRQAALYLDALGADRFLIIGVQKKAPHEVRLFDAMLPLASSVRAGKSTQHYQEGQVHARFLCYAHAEKLADR